MFLNKFRIVKIGNNVYQIKIYAISNSDHISSNVNIIGKYIDNNMIFHHKRHNACYT